QPAGVTVWCWRFRLSKRTTHSFQVAPKDSDYVEGFILLVRPPVLDVFLSQLAFEPVDGAPRVTAIHMLKDRMDFPEIEVANDGIASLQAVPFHRFSLMVLVWTD